jgi:hypothetical protein
MTMSILDANNGTVLSRFAKLDKDTKIPMEFLIEGDFNQVIEAYEALLKKDA